MKELLIIVFVWCLSIVTFSQGIVLRDQDGHVVDTLRNELFYVIRNDTLTRYQFGKSLSPDKCSSFSIIRKIFIGEAKDFRLIMANKIVIESKCSSLLTNDDAYCLHLTDFKFNKNRIKISIVDSEDRTLKARIKRPEHFEAQLKYMLEKFISRQECIVVTVEQIFK
jgi:hypothetical protein